jgi:hypothetical protein
MFNLGLLYDEGHGVAQDYAKAREWYEKAADIARAVERFDDGRGALHALLPARQDHPRAFCETDQSAIIACRRSLSRSSMVSIRSSLRSRCTS